MIRDAVEGGWELITHAAHAHLAGEMAKHWKNKKFEPPMPFAHVLDAVSRHDDSWIARDNDPMLTEEGLPSAFSSALVGTYEAFEEITLEPYLEVRKQATNTARERDPYAAVLISMHTVNLLTEQADLTELNTQQRNLHTNFIRDQRAIQSELKDQIRNQTCLDEYASDEQFRRSFEFLQACDSLSLYVCVDYKGSTSLRHEQPQTSGKMVSIGYERQTRGTYSCDPWPFDQQKLTLTIPTRYLGQRTFDDVESFRQMFYEAEIKERDITLTSV